MGAAFCASPSFPLPLSKAQPWLRRLRQERLHELTDHISQIIFNDVELTAVIVSTLKTNMRVRVKGGAAFSLHAQRLASLGFVNDLMEPLDGMHMMNVHDLDVSVTGQGAPTFSALQTVACDLNEVLAPKLRSLQLPRHLCLVAVHPVSVANYGGAMEWRSVCCGTTAWPGPVSCSYHGVLPTTDGMFTLMRVSLCCFDRRDFQIKRLHLIDVTLEKRYVAPEAADDLWSLQELCRENIRMLGTETSYMPWLNDHKTERRLGRLFGACCLQDLSRGRGRSAMIAAANMISWLCTERWHLDAWDDDYVMRPTSNVGWVCNWLKWMVLEHQAMNSKQYELQKDFIELALAQCTHAYNFCAISLPERVQEYQSATLDSRFLIPDLG